ncbi:hypothetical protein, partial [Okeania sp. SIO3I5]|uniref:hypothetical protein n=1 Tax=Okeania sp. SIO3I5 TaxID=2607805 RepID=UPI0025E79EA5
VGKFMFYIFGTIISNKPFLCQRWIKVDRFLDLSIDSAKLYNTKIDFFNSLKPESLELDFLVKLNRHPQKKGNREKN